MTHRLRNLKLCALALLVALPGLVQSADYWSGGAGAESRSEAPTHFNTRFEFFERSGAYLSGLEVTVSAVDGGNVLLETTTAGPWLMVDLPDGYYRIEAERPSSGEVQRVRFTVADGRTEGLMGLRYMD